MTKENLSLNPIDVVVGSNLRMMRTSRKISQTSLGEAVGISFQQIQKYERGHNRIGASRMWELCKFFECKPGDFFIGIESDSKGKTSSASKRTDLYQHPRGPAIAEAFLNLKDKDLEAHVISICRTLGNKN